MILIIVDLYQGGGESRGGDWIRDTPLDPRPVTGASHALNC